MSKLFKLNLTTFIFNEIGHFQSDKMSMKQIQGNCFFRLKKSAHVSAYVHGTHEDNEALLAAQTSLHRTKTSRVFWTQVSRLKILGIINIKICVSIRKSELDVSDTSCYEKQYN